MIFDSGGDEGAAAGLRHSRGGRSSQGPRRRVRLRGLASSCERRPELRRSDLGRRRRLKRRGTRSKFVPASRDADDAGASEATGALRRRLSRSGLSRRRDPPANLARPREHGRLERVVAAARVFFRGGARENVIRRFDLRRGRRPRCALAPRDALPVPPSEPKSPRREWNVAAIVPVPSVFVSAARGGARARRRLRVSPASFLRSPPTRHSTRPPNAVGIARHRSYGPDEAPPHLPKRALALRQSPFARVQRVPQRLRAPTASEPPRRGRP